MDLFKVSNDFIGGSIKYDYYNNQYEVLFCSMVLSLCMKFEYLYSINYTTLISGCIKIN